MKRGPYKPRGKGVVDIVIIAAVFVVILILVAVPTWDAPWDPIESREWGWRGIAMNTFTSKRTRTYPWNVVPPAIPPYDPSGEPASATYENVQVLGELDSARFDHLMASLTQWVAPEQGCNYCHVTGESFASDALYTKRVARQMLLMTRDINANSRHVGTTGVTCYTCHRGNPVPRFTWFKAAESRPPMGGDVGMPPPWVRTAENMRDFLPRRPFEDYLLDDKPITGSQARRWHGKVADLGKLEDIYILMMQMSDGMGVNCNFCHNSRAFNDWSQSTPKRINAWYGIRMTRALNNNYLTPLETLLPRKRLGPQGDVPKADCATCHQRQAKPLGGAAMAHAYAGLYAFGGRGTLARDNALETREPGRAELMLSPPEPAGLVQGEGKAP
ncbi:MAG: photosynthetic reaction center cytochrome c subunit [Porphyrobacter sp.]|nr:photosynthetic reaction center cytochrome c subunit [Porphyrobacter sp.]